MTVGQALHEHVPKVRVVEYLGTCVSVSVTELDTAGLFNFSSRFAVSIRSAQSVDSAFLPCFVPRARKNSESSVDGVRSRKSTEDLRFYSTVVSQA